MSESAQEVLECGSWGCALGGHYGCAKLTVGQMTLKVCSNLDDFVIC